MVIFRFILGVLIVAAGIAGVRYNYEITNSFGRFASAEKWLGGGGTFLLFKMLAVIIIFVGLLIAFGLWTPFTNWMLSPLTSILNLNI